MELDQFMKELVVEFPEDVMALFFPRLARRLDFSQTSDLNKELYTHSPKGVERFVDVLIEVKVKNPPPEAVVTHFESQQHKRIDFPARVMGYYCLAYTREIKSQRKDTFSVSEFTTWQKQKEIVSFAFCHYRLKKAMMRQRYQKGSGISQLSCRFTAISLPMLSAKGFLRRKRAAVCGLAVFMNPNGFSQPELKVACYRKLISFLPRLTTRQVNLIVYALETYLKLSETEQQLYQRLIQEVYPEVTKMITNPLIEQGIRQGLQQGLQQGIQQGLQQGESIGLKRGLQESVLQVLSDRFSQLPSEIRSRIVAVEETDKLKRLLSAALTTDSLETFTKNGLLG